MSEAIGVFDSGFGGLTILKSLRKAMPSANFIYLGDNARAPYGTKTFEQVYEYTLQAVKWLFTQNCSLVVLACNTASAKALRSIQQNDLTLIGADKRVLGVIRPTAEVIGDFSRSKHIGILGTPGTVNSSSYVLEIRKFFPKVKVVQQACTNWVQLVEDHEQDQRIINGEIKKDLDAILQKDTELDVVLLACTHYPLLKPAIEKQLPSSIKLISQGDIIAEKLVDYLERHPDIKTKLGMEGELAFFTTGDAAIFDEKGSLFYEQKLKSTKISLV